MDRAGDPIVLLIAEDDEDDFILIKETMEKGRLSNEIRWVKDGEELMEYLCRRGEYRDPGKAPFPGLILLDLNMPRKDGREALKEIKADEKLRSIPVTIFTTSRTEEDIIRSYDLGVNSFIQKPVRYDAFVEAVKALGRYWFEIVALPPEKESTCECGE
ncbi:MAG: response regulator [bacterium]